MGEVVFDGGESRSNGLAKVGNKKIQDSNAVKKLK